MALITLYPADKKVSDNFYRVYAGGMNKEVFQEGFPFAELVIVKGTEKFLLFGLTNIRKPSFKNNKTGEMYETNLPVLFQIRHTKGKGYGDKDEEPSELELKIGEVIESKELASDLDFLHGENLKCWQCKFVYDDTSPQLIANSGFDFLEKRGKERLPDLPGADAIRSSTQSNSQYNKGAKTFVPAPTEYEKGKDKIKLLLEDLPEDWKIATLTDYAILSNPELASKVNDANGTGLKGITDVHLKAEVLNARKTLLSEVLNMGNQQKQG